MKTLLEHDRVVLFGGDSADLDLPEASVDAIVCDPPSAAGFMNRKWDDDRGGFGGWTRWFANVLAPSVRALRPGGHALFWGLPRTVHYTMRGIELAGLEIRDVHHDVLLADDVAQAFLESLDDAQRVLLARTLDAQSAPVFYHVFLSGFPKAVDVARQIDMHLCTLPGRHCDKNLPRKRREGDHLCPPHPRRAIGEGLFSALKPAVEPWVLARKPLAGTYAENFFAHGTGVLNVGACRIGSEARFNPAAAGNKAVLGMPADAEGRATMGRWPPHLSLRHASGCEVVGTETEQVVEYENDGEHDRDGNSTDFAMGRQRPGAAHEIVRDRYRCADGCPVAELDAQSGGKTGSNGGDVVDGGIGYKGGAHGAGRRVAKSKGGASRLFYTPKPSRRAKDEGLDHLEPRSGGDATDREDDSAGLSSPRAGAGRTGGARNPHETVKSTELMKWLITLVAPPAEAIGRPAVILDPFAGSGSTGVAALELGHDFIGCEITEKYWPAFEGRIAHALKGD